LKISPRTVWAAAGALLASACAVGPNYHRPTIDAAASYKEVDGWKPTRPADAMARGEWWKIFDDAILNDLEAKVDVSNENIKVAAANFEQARAIISEAKAGFWPTIGATVGLQRQQASDRAATTVAGGGTTILTPGSTNRPFTTVTAGATGNWTVDIWGEIRRTVEADRDTAESQNATLANARLAAQGELAIDYYELRAQDQLQKLLDDTVEAETQSLKIAESRYKFGVGARADVVSAQTQLLQSQAQQVNARIQRGVLEHAIAVLIGEQPAIFSVERLPIRTDVPTVPPGVPSELLERRPDIATAERHMASANAQIGVAVSAWFPSLTLSGQLSYENTAFGHLIRTSNRVWAVGPLLAETLFDGGLRRAQVRAARAAYNSAVASYRQSVLTAFQQVEDDIITLKVLEEQNGIEEQAVKAAREAETLTLNQYKAGTVPYTSVIIAQTTRLSAEETALQVLSSRLQTSVQLIEAVGGGWEQAQEHFK
jgi:NodT family efflux transporter outer membrane factor (OMF) lipoprotein